MVMIRYKVYSFIEKYLKEGLIMKVIAINGSPRKDGNTSQALKVMADELKKHGIDVETIQIGHLKKTDVFLKMTLSMKQQKK